MFIVISIILLLPVNHLGLFSYLLISSYVKILGHYNCKWHTWCSFCVWRNCSKVSYSTGQWLVFVCNQLPCFILALFSSQHCHCWLKWPATPAQLPRAGQLTGNHTRLVSESVNNWCSKGRQRKSFMKQQSILFLFLPEDREGGNHFKARVLPKPHNLTLYPFKRWKDRGGTHHAARSLYYIQWPVREEELEAQARLLLLDRWGPSAFETVHRAVKRTYWAQTSLNQFTATLWKSLWSKHNRVPPRCTWCSPCLLRIAPLWSGLEEKKKKQKKKAVLKNKPARPHNRISL